MISIEDRLAIHELISLHGHLVDDGKFKELHRVFLEDAIFDLSTMDLGLVKGLVGLREITMKLGDAHPVGHHVSNIIITHIDDDEIVYTQSKGFGIMKDGNVGSAIYEDVIKRQPNKEWRIVRRKIMARKEPLKR